MTPLLKYSNMHFIDSDRLLQSSADDAEGGSCSADGEDNTDGEDV